MLTGFEEDVKNEAVFRQHDSNSEHAVLANNGPHEGRFMKTAFHDAHMKDSDVVYARPPPERQPETLDPNRGTVVWKLQEIWSRSSKSAALSPDGSDNAFDTIWNGETR